MLLMFEIKDYLVLEVVASHFFSVAGSSTEGREWDQWIRIDPSVQQENFCVIWLQKVFCDCDFLLWHHFLALWWSGCSQYQHVVTTAGHLNVRKHKGFILIYFQTYRIYHLGGGLHWYSVLNQSTQSTKCTQVGLGDDKTTLSPFLSQSLTNWTLYLRKRVQSVGLNWLMKFSSPNPSFPWRSSPNV